MADASLRCLGFEETAHGLRHDEIHGRASLRAARAMAIANPEDRLLIPLARRRYAKSVFDVRSGRFVPASDANHSGTGPYRDL